MYWWNATEKIEDEQQHVIKFIFTKEDAVAEAVLYRYPDYKTRTVICCSTQSGCPIGCRFCGAGDNFIRSLTAHEIVAQVYYCITNTKIRSSDMKRLQIMFMSMGEPLLNFKQLGAAIEDLNILYPHAELLISTSAPKVSRKIIQDLINLSVKIDKIGLQFSIHESTDEARNKLIPFAKKMTLKEIANLGYEWNLATDRKPFINYCAHDENTDEDDAKRLTSIFHPYIFNATVSVVCERSEGLSQSNDHQKTLAIDFAAMLVRHGYDVRVFDPAGQDTIGGGCGQLHYVQKYFKEHPDLIKPSVGFDKPVVHVPKELDK